MDEYTDERWLDNLAVQYEIVREAWRDLMEVVAEDGAARLGEKLSEIEAALTLSEGPVDRAHSRFESWVNIRRRLQTLMGNDEFERVRSMFALLDGVMASITTALSKRKGGTASGWRDQLESYLDTREEFYVGSFAHWLRIEVAAE